MLNRLSYPGTPIYHFFNASVINYPEFTGFKQYKFMIAFLKVRSPTLGLTVSVGSRGESVCLSFKLLEASWFLGFWAMPFSCSHLFGSL